MSHVETKPQQLSATTFPISADEGAREAALRGYFADFWGTAQGSPRARLQDSARQYLGGADPRDPRGSPLFGDLTGLPPLLLQVGTDERLLDDSRQYAERAAAAGVPVRLEVWQGMHHVFQLDVARLESSRVALDRAAAFLTEAFSRG